MKKKIMAVISLLLIGTLCLPMTSIKSKADGDAYHEVTNGTIVEADWKYADALTSLGSFVKVGQGVEDGNKWIEYKVENGYTYHNGKQYDIHLKLYPNDVTYNSLEPATTGSALTATIHPHKQKGTQPKPQDSSGASVDDPLRPYAGTQVNVIQLQGVNNNTKNWIYELWLEKDDGNGGTVPVTNLEVPFVVGTVWNASGEREKIYSTSDVIYTSTQLCKMHAGKTKTDDGGNHIVKYTYDDAGSSTGFKGWYPTTQCDGNVGGSHFSNCGVGAYSSDPAEYILGLGYDNTDINKSIVRGGYAAPGNSSAQFEFRMGWQAYEVNFTDNVGNVKVTKTTQDRPLGVNPAYPALGSDTREIIYWTADHDFLYKGETIPEGTKISDVQLKEILKELDDKKIVKKTGDPYERITFTAYVSNHTHDFIYEDNTSKPSVDRNKIQSYCNNDDADKDDCPFYGEEKKEVLVITTPDMQYNGSVYDKTSVTDDVTPLTGASKEIKYYKTNKEGAISGGTEIGTTPPTDTGYYYAVVTLKEGSVSKASAVSPFKIYSVRPGGGTGGGSTGGGSTGGGYVPSSTIPEKKYKVEFETPFGPKPDTQSGIKSGGTVSDPINTLKPGYTTEDGHVFEGWYLDEACTIPYDFNSAVSKDIVLYAKWETATTGNVPTETPNAPVVKVEFETEIGETPATQVEVPGNTATDPGAPMDLATLKPGTIINGYRFEGWYLDKDYTIKYNFDTPLTEDIVLYAKWASVGLAKSPKTEDAALPLGVGVASALLLALSLFALSGKRRKDMK